jgi:hypothetical protein
MFGPLRYPWVVTLFWIGWKSLPAAEPQILDPPITDDAACQRALLHLVFTFGCGGARSHSAKIHLDIFYLEADLAGGEPESATRADF